MTPCRLLVIGPSTTWAPSAGSSLGGRTLAVDQAGSISEARDLSPDGPWDVVTFHTGTLPDLSPAEILDALRDLAPEATLLPVSPSPDPREALFYLKHGAFEYLEEPLSPGDFLRAFAEAVENREAFREILDMNRTLETQRNELLREKEELERKNRELEAISHLARGLASSLEPAHVVDRLSANLLEAFPEHRAWIGLLDRTLGREELRATRPEDAPSVPREDGVPPPWMRQVYQEGRPLEVEKPNADPRVRDTALGKLHRGAFVKVPLVARGRTVGSLTLESGSDGGRIEPDEMGLLGIFADTAAIALENALLYQSMRELSLRDELTGLYNRRHFFEQLEAEWNHADRHHTPLSLLVLDIDHFKQLNDGNDHLTGDAALKRLAELLIQNTRGIDTVARYGGEEFVVILPQTPREGSATAGEKLRSVVARTPFPGEAAVPGGKLKVSIGAAWFRGEGDTPRALIERADHAVYRAKETGRDRVMLWEDPSAPPTAKKEG